MATQPTKTRGCSAPHAVKAAEQRGAAFDPVDTRSIEDQLEGPELTFSRDKRRMVDGHFRSLAHQEDRVADDRFQADLFRAEGDTATADALVARNESTSSRPISDEDRRRILLLQRKGNRLDSQGAHDEAVGCPSGELRLIEDGFGLEHADVSDHLNELAR